MDTLGSTIASDARPFRWLQASSGTACAYMAACTFHTLALVPLDARSRARGLERQPDCAMPADHGVWQPREAGRYECIAAPDGSSSSFHWLGMAAACATAACMVREATSDALPQLQLLISQHVAKRSAARQSTICTMLSPIELPSNRLTNSTHMMPGSRPSSGEARNSRYSKLQLVPEACTPSERSRGFSGDNLAMLARVVRVRHRCDRLRPHAHHRGACVECGGEVGPRCLMHEK